MLLNDYDTYVYIYIYIIWIMATRLDPWSSWQVVHKIWEKKLHGWKELHAWEEFFEWYTAVVDNMIYECFSTGGSTVVPLWRLGLPTHVILLRRIIHSKNLKGASPVDGHKQLEPTVWELKHRFSAL